MWKKTKVFSKSSPILNTLLLVLRCLADYYGLCVAALTFSCYFRNGYCDLSKTSTSIVRCPESVGWLRCLSCCFMLLLLEV
jgi:hypothetical protein